MSSGIFNCVVCCICWRELTIDTCAVDALGDRWDCCPGKCADDCGMITGPVNIYIYGQLLFEHEQYQKHFQQILNRGLQESTYPIDKSSNDSKGLFQQIAGKWE